MIVKLDKSLAVISLDFFKALDRVDWDFIFSLHKLCYQDRFIQMIKTAHTNIQSKIKMKPCHAQNGQLTKYLISQV